MEKDDNHKTIGIYAIAGIENKSAIKIQHLENVKLEEGQVIKDSLIETFDIMDKVSGSIYACRITNTYLTSTKKQPLIYVVVNWSDFMIAKVFFKLYINFTIESEINTEQELYKKRHYGTFTLDVIIDGKSRTLNKKIEKFPGQTKIIELLKDFIKTESMIEFIKSLIDEEKEKLREKYKDDFIPFKKIPQATISLKDILND